MVILDFSFYKNYKTVLTISADKYITKRRVIRKRAVDKKY